MITMKDIAREVGVTQQAVSVALGGSFSTTCISKKNRQKVLEAAERMGYRRNEIARAIKNGKTNVIGVIGGFTGTYSLDIILGIAGACTANGYFMKLLPVNVHDDLGPLARQCVEHRVAGVICRSVQEHTLDTLRNELEDMHTPIVLVDSSRHHDWCSRVVSDDFNGEKLAVDHLYELGHRKIAHFTSNLNSGFAKMRYDGFCSAIGDHNLELLDNPVEVDDQYEEISEELSARVMRILRKYRPTAVCCGSDPLAMKVLNIATAAGIKIPQELSVVGFAGLDYTHWTIPPLTTVRQPFAEMGKTAAEILFSEIKHKTPIRELKLPVELITRQSSAAGGGGRSPVNRRQRTEDGGR
jgi:DNA-binding LacI/PurR family transcriptional regulator